MSREGRKGSYCRLGLFFSFPFFLGGRGLGEGVGVRDIFLVCSSLVGVLGTGTLGSTTLEYSCMMRREGERWMSWLVAFQGSLHGGGCVALYPVPVSYLVGWWTGSLSYEL